MADTAENGSPSHQPGADAPPAAGATEHLNIKVTDNNNEVFFKIKRSTKLEKLMTAFCERQGKTLASVRFLFEGQRVQPGDTPDTVSLFMTFSFPFFFFYFFFFFLSRLAINVFNTPFSWKCKTAILWRSTKNRSADAKSAEIWVRRKAADGRRLCDVQLWGKGDAMVGLWDQTYLVGRGIPRGGLLLWGSCRCAPASNPPGAFLEQVPGT